MCKTPAWQPFFMVIRATTHKSSDQRSASSLTNVDTKSDKDCHAVQAVGSIPIVVRGKLSACTRPGRSSASGVGRRTWNNWRRLHNRHPVDQQIRAGPR